MRVFRRLHATLDRIDETLDRNTAAFDRNTAAFEDLQVVIRESRIREERALQQFAAAMERIGADADARMQAVWKMLERWGEGPAPSS